MTTPNNVASTATGAFAYPAGTLIDAPTLLQNTLPNTPKYVNSADPRVPGQLGAMSIAGILDEDSAYPFLLTGTVSYQNVGAAVAVNPQPTTPSNVAVQGAVRLAQPNDVILGQLFIVESRSTFGIVTGTVQTEGGLLLPVDPAAFGNAVAWYAGMPTFVGENVLLPNGVSVTCSVAGTTGATAPTGPGVDGTATWIAFVGPVLPWAPSTAFGIGQVLLLPNGVEVVITGGTAPYTTGTVAPTGAGTDNLATEALFAGPALVQIGGSVCGGLTTQGTVQGLPISFARTNVVTAVDNVNNLATVLFL